MEVKIKGNETYVLIEKSDDRNQIEVLCMTLEHYGIDFKKVVDFSTSDAIYKLYIKAIE